MNEKLAKYFKNSRAQIEEAKRKERDELLISLGLYEEGKQYAPEGNSSHLCSIQGYNLCETVDGKERYYKIIKNKAIEVSDEEYKQICDLEQEKKQLAELKAKHGTKSNEYRLTPTVTGSKSRAASWLQTCAVITWIGGLICALILSIHKVQTSYYSSEIVVSWGLLLSMVIGFGLAGYAVWCFSEIFENIQSIADSLRGMDFKKL